MYNSLLLPWSTHPSQAETLYRASGLVRTKGTIFLLPPSLSTLRSSFNAPPRPQTRMSSGAVALCKHFERGGASSEHGLAHPFWTLPRGRNEEKTATAASILERMLDDARWRNVMMLHQGVAVYEVRNRQGYGMRWTLELHRDGQDAAEQSAIEERREVGGTKGNDDHISSAADQELSHVDHSANESDDALKGWSIKRRPFEDFWSQYQKWIMNLNLRIELGINLL